MTDPALTALWLRITLAFGFGGYKKWQYIDIDDVKNSVEMLLSNPALQNDEHINKYKRLSSKQIDSIFETCKKNDISIVTPSDEEYPERFRHLPDPPSVLFVLGDIRSVSDVPSVAIVGARECCDYSASLSGTFAASLAEHGINIVSGFARGIDQRAHLAALEAGSVTTAFLGSGILRDYPKGTMRLKKLISEHGAVISEYLPTSFPTKQSFKVRNRMISALSDCVLVAEASSHSGALNTANHAAEQGKEVFVIPPHDLYDKRFDGQSELLLDGAQIAVHPDQIFEFLMELYGRK